MVVFSNIKEIYGYFFIIDNTCTTGHILYNGGYNFFFFTSYGQRVKAIKFVEHTNIVLSGIQTTLGGGRRETSVCAIK